MTRRGGLPGLLDRSDRRKAGFGVWLILFLAYVVAGPPPGPVEVSVDVRSNEMTAWSLATRGTPYLDEFAHIATPENFGSVSWLIRREGRTVVDYPPGAPLLAAPFYLGSPRAVAMLDVKVADNQHPGEWISSSLPIISHLPGTIMASLATSLAMVIVYAIGCRTLTPRKAAAYALVAGLGTAAYSVAADALWQHGPAILSVLLAGYFLDTGREVRAGLSMAWAVLTRPQTAILALVIGVWLSLSQRSLRPLLRFGGPASLGAVAYFLYTWLVIGRFGQAGAVLRFAAQPSERLPDGLLQTLVDPHRGLLVLSPFLLLVSFGFRSAWVEAAPWKRAGAVAGLLLLLGQLRVLSWHGGGAFFGYRYPLESLAAAAPLMLLAASHAARRSVLHLWALRLTSVVSVAIHTYGAFR